MNSSVVIVPGLNNSGPQHWQSLWQRQLPNAVRVKQQRWDKPDLIRWSDNVAAVLDAVDTHSGCWIVAHSFGCLASVRALMRSPERSSTYLAGGAATNLTGGAANHLIDKVRGLFLVAPADPHKFAVAEQLPAGPLPPGHLIASRSDPWLSWTGAQQWAQRWQLELIDAGDAGHINAESGHGYWRQGWHLFQQLRLQQLRGDTVPLPSRAAEPRWALAI
jgi:uncharacterized protein